MKTTGYCSTYYLFNVETILNSICTSKGPERAWQKRMWRVISQTGSIGFDVISASYLPPPDKKISSPQLYFMFNCKKSRECVLCTQHSREQVTPGLKSFVSGSKNCDLSGILGRIQNLATQSLSESTYICLLKHHNANSSCGHCCLSSAVGTDK